MLDEPNRERDEANLRHVLWRVADRQEQIIQLLGRIVDKLETTTETTGHWRWTLETEIKSIRECIIEINKRLDSMKQRYGKDWDLLEIHPKTLWAIAGFVGVAIWAIWQKVISN